VAASQTVTDLRSEADEIIAVLTPFDLSSIGEWYADFAQTSDEEVRSLLAAARSNV